MGVVGRWIKMDPQMKTLNKRHHISQDIANMDLLCVGPTILLGDFFWVRFSR